MRYLLLMTLGIFLSAQASARDTQDLQELGYHLEICNSCDSYLDYKNVALEEAPVGGKVVISNLTTGEVRAYMVEADMERGRQQYVWGVPVPEDAEEATQVMVAWLDDLESQFYSSAPPRDYQSSSATAETDRFDRDMPIMFVHVPAELGGINVSTARITISNRFARQQVSNFVRVSSLRFGLTLKLQAHIQQFLTKIPVTVTAIHADGSKTEWLYSNSWRSDMPFHYKDGSATDANGNLIDTGGPGGGGGTDSYSFRAYGGIGVTMTTSCASTSTSGDGITWRGTVCWIHPN